jgi:type III restriction enzyme
MGQTAKEVVPVDLETVSRQSFSENMLKEHGSVWYAQEESSPFTGPEVHLWEQYQRFRKQMAEYGDDASEQAKAIGSRLQEVDLRAFKCPWNVHYASHEPERQFSMLLFENADLFDAFVKMPNQGGYSFPYSYKPAKTAKTHVANENFNPDFFIRVRSKHDILVVEVKAEGDDSNRNRAKYRDGQKHFEMLNEKLAELKEPWHYHFYFLSPEDYVSFFGKVKSRNYPVWKSGLMQALG